MPARLSGKIKVTAGPDRGRELEFPSDRKIVIGREPRNDLQLTDSEVSRVHCEIAHENDGFWITDLKSRNGVKIAGRRVDRAKLGDSTTFEVGLTQIEFEAILERPGVDEDRFHKPSVGVRKRPPRPAGEEAEEEATTSAPERGDPFAGRKIGDFKLVAPLGGGDSTYVYKAIQFSKNRLVAIKILPPEMAINKSVMKRFVRGAKSGSQLRHPNIVRILGGGLSDGLYYVWMEYVDGQSLRTLMRLAKSGRVALRSALDIVSQIGEALMLAHEKRIVHRNVKPGNILVGKDGIVKLADLGLAKTMEDEGASDITDPGTILGTLNYMSPEQIQDAGVVDHRSDIYSLGATLYAMLTGVEPFAAPTTLDTIIRIQKEPVEPPQKHDPKLPEQVCSIIMRAMAKLPEDRYQTPQGMIEDVKALREALAE